MTALHSMYNHSMHLKKKNSYSTRLIIFQHASHISATLIKAPSPQCSFCICVCPGIKGSGQNIQKATATVQTLLAIMVRVIISEVTGL